MGASSPKRIVARIARCLPVAALALAVAIPSAARAQALMDEAAVRVALEDIYGVRVLRLEADYRDGVDVFVARVMNPGGDFNEAFQVSVLVVDRRTGMLVPQFRHAPSGIHDAGGPRSGAE